LSFFDILKPFVDVDVVNIAYVNIVNMARREKIPATSPEQRDTYHHGDLKRALTEAALGLVSEKGPKGFTLREVARRAGVSTAAPYRHFADKADLLAAVATQGFVQLHETLSAVAAETTDLHDRMVDMARAYVRWAVTHPDYYQAMFGAETDKSDHPELLMAGARAFDDLLDAITRCQEANMLPHGDPREIAGPTWSLLHGIASLTIGRDLSHVGIRDDPQALAERSLRALLFR
jgi:AcrR family transcriptional regulator